MRSRWGPAVGVSTVECMATMTDSNKKFGELLSEKVFLNQPFLELMTQIHSLLRKGFQGAVAGRRCLLSVAPVC